MRNLVSLPQVSAEDILETIGLERRSTFGNKLAKGAGFVVLGVLFGAGAVLARAMMMGKESRRDQLSHGSARLEKVA